MPDPAVSPAFAESANSLYSKASSNQPSSPKQNEVAECKTSSTGTFVGILIATFFIVAVFVFLLLYSFRPTWVLVPGEDPKRPINKVKVMIISIVVALLVVLLVWGVKAIASGA